MYVCKYLHKNYYTYLYNKTRLAGQTAGPNKLKFVVGTQWV